MNGAPQAHAGTGAGQAVFEEAARRAEQVAVDLVHRASALLGWASENRFTDPDPATPADVADALEKHARALREQARAAEPAADEVIEEGVSTQEPRNRGLADRARSAFLASPHAAEENEPLTNLADLVADLLHLADTLTPQDDPLGDAATKRGHERRIGRSVTLGEFTAARALGHYRAEMAGM